MKKTVAENDSEMHYVSLIRLGDHHWGCVNQLLAINFAFTLYPVRIPEVFAKVN